MFLSDIDIRLKKYIHYIGPTKTRLFVYVNNFTVIIIQAGQVCQTLHYLGFRTKLLGILI